MDEKEVPINKKTIVNVSRNTPVTLVVGAAGFLGSHLVDHLLKKGIQVIGVDDLSSGKKENLEVAVKDKNFHMLFEDAGNLHLDLERLDYIFIAAGSGWKIGKILDLFKEKKCRCLLISTIDLYDEDKKDAATDWFRKNEIQLARFASEHKLNARILRLGSVFGPRMNFQNEDPVTRLIQASLTGQLQKEMPLDFSSRSIYVSDACDLAIKCMLAGATAQKIFDGCLPNPVKVSEIKQILLDPIWHDTRGFQPSELPPWLTPNLLKTINFLNWKPKSGLVEGLRETLSYFKDHEIKVPRLEAGNWNLETGEEEGSRSWKEEKKEQLKAIGPQPEAVSKPAKKGMQRIYLFLIILIVIYGLIWPLFRLSYGVLTFRWQLVQANQSLIRGEFDKGLKSIAQAEAGVLEAQTIYSFLEPLRNFQVLGDFFLLGDNLSHLAQSAVVSSKSAALGIEALYKGLKATTGDLNEDPHEAFSKAQVELIFADQQLSWSLALIKDEQFRKDIPEILKSRVDSLEKKLLMLNDLVKKARSVSIILPQVIGKDEARNYLVLLQNNMELRPTGGFIGSYALLGFEGSKLKKIEVNDVYAIDGQLKIHVEPPKEIKEDLGQKDWYFRDSNWESDFPTSARQAEWFFTKETGQKVHGVLALDISAIEDLLGVVGSLDLADYEEEITADNLFEKSISYAETNFFAGSQAKKNFLTSLSLALFNKLFFLPNQNWPGIVTSLGQSLETKHISVFLDDLKLFSYILSNGWAHALPRPSEDRGIYQDFLAPVEANLGANKANYYLERTYNLEVVLGKDGELSNRLKINYINNSPSETFPAGLYKNRLRVYLPFGAKLTRILWGEEDITKNVSSFLDFGRSGYSMLLQIKPKEQKELVLDWQQPQKLEFVDGKAKYRLDVVKQAGTLKDPFYFRLTFPINYKLESQLGKIAPQEQIIETDLSRDRSFEMVFTK